MASAMQNRPVKSGWVASKEPFVLSHKDTGLLTEEQEEEKQICGTASSENRNWPTLWCTEAALGRERTWASYLTCPVGFPD